MSFEFDLDPNINYPLVLELESQKTEYHTLQYAFKPISTSNVGTLRKRPDSEGVGVSLQAGATIKHFQGTTKNQASNELTECVLLFHKDSPNPYFSLHPLSSININLTETKKPVELKPTRNESTKTSLKGRGASSGRIQKMPSSTDMISQNDTTKKFKIESEAKTTLPDMATLTTRTQSAPKNSHLEKDSRSTSSGPSLTFEKGPENLTNSTNIIAQTTFAHGQWPSLMMNDDESSSDIETGAAPIQRDDERGLESDSDTHDEEDDDDDDDLDAMADLIEQQIEKGQ